LTYLIDSRIIFKNTRSRPIWTASLLFVILKSKHSATERINHESQNLYSASQFFLRIQSH
ncbi:MAG: hypothetical protein D6735_08130, partial [Acidobacteria bacterium]